MPISIPSELRHRGEFLVDYANGPEAVRELTSYIRFYNAERRNSSLWYVSPAQFETNLAVPK